jgi:hypothetical protein
VSLWVDEDMPRTKRMVHRNAVDPCHSRNCLPFREADQVDPPT